MNIELNVAEFLQEFSNNCNNVQKKFFKKNQIITTYIQKRNQICILLKGEAHLVRYDLNGSKSIIEHFIKDDIFGDAFYIVSVNNELSVEYPFLVFLTTGNFNLSNNIYPSCFTEDILNSSPA